MTRTRRCATTVALAALLWAAGAAAAPPALTQAIVDPGKAAKVKAAYLLNFIRYTKWPDAAFDMADSPIVLMAVGSCAAADVLSEVVRRAPPVENHPVVLSRGKFPGGRDGSLDEPELESFLEAARRSHVLYVCGVEGRRVRPALERLRDAYLLTVGDSPDFTRSGGMLAFVLRDDRIVFEANLEALQAAPVSVSGKVLKLAEIVDGVER